MLRRILSGQLSSTGIERLKRNLGTPLPPAARQTRQVCLWICGLSGAVLIASAAALEWHGIEAAPRWTALWCTTLGGGFMISFATEIRHGRVSTFARTATVHRATHPVSFTICAIAAIVLCGALTLTSARALVLGAW